MIKPARKKRYNWPPPPDPDAVYVPKERNPIHSILTALPVIMLVVGLYFHYQGESEQTESTPIHAESVDAEGIFTGLSVVQSGGTGGRHYLWFEVDGSARGVRLQAEQAASLHRLERGQPVMLRMGPSVSGSRTLWLWHVEQAGEVFLDASDTLQ